METFNFSVPQDITVGKGSLSKLPEIAKKLGGKHALIISGPHLGKMGLVKKAADYLASVDIKTDTFTGKSICHNSGESHSKIPGVRRRLYRSIRRRLTDGCGKSSGSGCQIWRKRHRL